MLVNLSNHPFDFWDEKQRNEAHDNYGNIVDIPFPDISPTDDTKMLVELAKQYVGICLEKLNGSSEPHNAVHLMGEMTFSFALVAALQREGITCIASTARRNVSDFGNGQKNVRFDFVSFREYPRITI
ncbi:MAG: CRISPR-associated protein [Sphingobacteriia bacterium]|nr:CRISPR-associated protein [Sphingobacteriia bacterium]